MASEFVNAYLKKREEEKKANPSSSVSDRSQFAQEYLSKRYEGDASGMAQRADANDIYYDFVTGKSYSASQRAAERAKEASYIKPRRLQSALDAAQSMQKEADRYSNILMREPESGVLMPDYDAIVAANNSQNSLSLAARSRALARKALVEYEKQYRTQLDSYGPYVDGSGKDVAGQYNARKKAVDDANQAYEDAFADYQKKQQAADYARRQDDKRKALQNEWAQYKQIQADKSKAETDAAQAWNNYYSMLPRAEDFASNQQNAYSRSSYADRMDKITSNRYSEEEQIRDLVMTDEELAIMTYLRNTQGEDAAQRYYNSLGLSERLKKHYENAFYEFGDENPVGASVVSTWHNLANEIYGPAGIAKAKLSGQELDPDADYFKYGKLRDAARAGVMQDMGPTGQFVYQTLMSAVLDSGVNGLIGAATGGSTWLGAGLTGASGFSDMVRQVKARGADDTQALVLGLIEGAAEVVTEKMGFDRLADLLTSKTPFKSALKSVLANMMSEFGEESITTVINQTADYLYGEISGRETEFTGRIEDYMAEGKTEGEALANALLDMGGDVLMDGLGGALGGVVMGGGSVAINKGISAAVAKYADYKYNQQQNASQTAQETTQAQQTAQETENQVETENRAQTAQEAETRARIERLAQETADAEMGEQAARQEMRQTEQQRVQQTTRQAAQTTENASAESVHNAAAVYGRDAASFESHYEGGTLQNYRRAFDAVYQAGKVNLSLEQVNQAGGEIVSGLSDQAKAEIWQAGRNAAASVVVPGVSKQYVGKMNHNQRTQVRILDAIGKKYGIQIDVVNSLDYGKTAGNAALVGRNHIVVASDAMNSAYVQAGVHELVHNLRRESSAYYDAFSSVVLDTLKKDGSFDLQAAIAERIRQYAEQGQQLSQEDALEEIVAEAAPAALTNREAMRAFVNENRSLAEKVRDFFVRFADELREIAAKYGAGNSRAEVDAMLRADAQDLVSIAESLDMALSAAQEAQASAQVGVSEMESASGEIEPQFSRKNGIEFATDKYYDSLLDRLEDLKSGSYISVGRVMEGSVLNRVGLPAEKLFFDVSKINKALSKHGDHITVDTLKTIPEILRNPVVIVDAGKGNTISVFGDLEVSDVPVMVGVMVTYDRTGRNVINKVRTIHARSDVSKLISDESVLYLSENKKRTREWFQARGIIVPLGGTKFGVIRSIAYSDTSVNPSTGFSSETKTKFSLQSPVEETKDLVAVHNLSEENLQKSLKLGGLPAPSIAIARAESGYSTYGPISLVFDKNSIDPEANDKNRVYGADAWTPIVPSGEEYETPEDVVRAMYATQAERGEERYVLDSETLQALAAPEYKSIDDIKEDSERLGNVNPYDYEYEVRHLNRQLNDVINRLIDDYDFAESDAEASVRRAASLEHNIDTVIESFASEEDGYHIDEEMAQEIIDLYEAAAALPTEFFEAKPQRAVYFDEVKAAIIPESTSESLKSELKERVGQVIEYEDGDEQARLEALNSLEDVKFSLKDTSEVDEQAKALLDGVDVELNAEVVQAYARSALRAADKDAAKINQQVRQAAGKILKDTASKYDRRTLESNMRAIVEAYARDGGEGVSQAAADMAKAIIEQNTHLDTTLRDQYSDLRRDLRESGVSLTESQKAEAASIYGSYNEFRKALMGTVKLTDKSMTLEARWGELSTMYPEIFQADTVEGDQINALMQFKQMMQPVYVNDFGMDMDTAAVDLGLRIQGDALSIAGAKEASKQLYGSAQKIENRVKKAYDTELKAQKKVKVAQFQEIAERLAEAKKLGDTQGYDNAMADYRKLIRKETGVKMPGGENMSPSAKMRFSQLAEAMQTAREANDTAAYQEAFKAYKELLKKERIQSTVVAPAVQDALNQARARFKASQEAKEGTVKKQKATKRVIKQAKDLVDMLANKKKGVRVPRMMQNNLLTLLEGLDINGRGASNKGELTQQAAAMREQLTALRQTYQEIWDSQSKGEAPAVLDGLMMVMSEEQRAQLDAALSTLEQGGRFTLRDMTTEQLKALGDALTTVKQTISTIGVLWRKGRYQNVAELADASIQEMGKRPEAKLKGMSAAGTTRDFLMLDMLEPVSYGERLGQAGSEIIQGLYEGERAKFGRLREAQEATAQMMEDSGVTGYDIGEWRKHVNTVRMGGHDVKLTDTQAMDIYLTAQRPQGKQHMLGDGIRLKTSKQTGAQVFTVHMTEEDIAKVSNLLSDKQKRLAHKMQGYLAGDVAKWGNDVTQQMYLYDYFTEQTYWPLTSDPNVLKTSEPSADRSLTAITQPGFMKPLTKNANNPVIIMDAVDVFNRHVAEMASYSGLAMPMTDALGYMNYKQRNEEGALTGSVKESMERLLGNGGGKYMVTLLQDLNHARYGDDLTHLSKLTGNYKRSAVSGKIRVVIQQPTAIARAAQEISPVYLAQGLKLGNKADIAEMQKYSALAWWKGNASGMDIGVGRSADQILWGDTSKLDTARTKVETAGGLIDAGKADDVTWAAMWRAVKRETQRIHPELQVGSEAYFKAVAERFDGIMDKTQVVDSIMHRSQIMRSQNGLIKELTAFQAEPIKSYNMLARSAMELGRNPKSKAAQTAAARSVLVFAANAALTALAEAAFDVFKHRDDDDPLMEYLLDAKKGFLKEYTDEFMGSWLDNLNVIAMIPGFSQAYEILTGGSAPEMMSFEGMSDAVQAAKTFVDHYFKGNTRKTTAYGAVAPVLKAASQITGLPIAGIMANTEMLAKVADPQWLNYKAVSGKFADNYEALYAAILEDDKRAITRIRGRLAADSQGASAKSPKQIDQGVANVLAEKDERIAQAYQLRKEGKASQLVALQKQIMADGFTEAMVTAAINRYENQAKTQEETAKEKDMNAQLTAKLFSYENLFAAMRTGSIEDVGVIAEYLEANSTAKDPAATIRSQVSGEFKQEYLDAVMNGGSADNLKRKLLSLGLTEDDLNGWVKSARYAELKESVGEGDVADAKQVAKELIDSGADVSDVVSSLNNKYKSVYIELVNSGRTAEAEKLQKDLESLGLIKKKTGQNYYRKDYMDKWVTDYNKKNK